MTREGRTGFRARLRAGTPQIGSYVTFPSPDVVELFARAGMDYVILDLQHASPDWQTLAHMIRAAEAGGTSPLVRVHTKDPAVILKVLESGAEGISLPGVKGVQQVAAAIDAIRYAPIGHRSACGHTRVGGYNSRRAEFGEHVRRQDERVALWIILEDPAAIAQASEIAAMDPGADVISVGRGDLSTSLGLFGQVDHPAVVEATERTIAEVARRSDGRTSSSIMIQKPEDIAPWLARGCRVFTYAADAILLMEAARFVVETFRASMPLEAAHGIPS